MHKFLLFLSMLLASAAVLTAQIPLPTFGSTFTAASATRGFYFQTPIPITITGLRVPDEANVGVQNVEVQSMSGPAPVYPATATGTQVFYANGAPSGAMIPCCLYFPAGSWIGVLGACGTTTMYNSYSGPIGGTFQSSIGNQPVTLNQLLTQTNLNTAGGQPYSGQAQGLGQIGRIEVYYETGQLDPPLGLPPYNNTNTAAASTKGFYFTTPVPILVHGLRVPDETGNGLQNVELRRLPANPPMAPATTSGGTEFYANNVPSGQVVQCSVLFAAGETIGVLGSCGTTTMYNSMSTTTGPVAATIAGQPTTLRRLISNTNLNTSQGQPWSADSGRIGRVEVYYEVYSGTPTATNYGSGCTEKSRAFYERFGPPNHTDLSGLSMVLTPAANGSPSYVVSYGGGYSPPPANATILSLSNDSEVSVQLSTPLHWFGTLVPSLQVCSNGFVSVGPGNGTSGAPDTAAWLASPVARWGTWHDFDPVLFGGHNAIKYHEIGNDSYITWDQVGSRAAGTPSTWQLQFQRTTGRVTFVWSSLGSAADWLVGYAPGGPAYDLGSFNLSSRIYQGFQTDAVDQAPLQCDATALPHLGSTLQFATSNIPAGSPFGVQMIGLASDNTGLGGLGAPRCFQWVQPVSTEVFLVTGPTSLSPLTIPPNAAFQAMFLFVQTATYSPGMNALNVLFSNGVRLMLDV